VLYALTITTVEAANLRWPSCCCAPHAHVYTAFGDGALNYYAKHDDLNLSLAHASGTGLPHMSRAHSKCTSHLPVGRRRSAESSLMQRHTHRLHKLAHSREDTTPIGQSSATRARLLFCFLSSARKRCSTALKARPHELLLPFCHFADLLGVSPLL
jgi:hypothetical protein